MHLLFPDLFDRPEHISFADQEEGEVIELLLRAHWVTNLPWIFLTILGILVPSVVYTGLLYLGVDLSQVPLNLQISLIILWYLLLLAYVLEKFLHWYFNIYIVTNMHLVDINFHNLLNRDKVEIRIEDVQSAKSIISGVFRSLFHFGDVIIETAAEKQRIEFNNVPKPDFVAERIQDVQSQAEGGK